MLMYSSYCLCFAVGVGQLSKRYNLCRMLKATSMTAALPFNRQRCGLTLSQYVTASDCKLWQAAVSVSGHTGLTSRRLVCQQCFVMQDPMVTNQGYIFSKEAILDFFLTQKELKKKELKEWEQAQQAVSDLVREPLVSLAAGCLPHSSTRSSPP